MIVGGDLEEDSRYTGVEEGDPAAGDHGSQHDLFDFKKTLYFGNVQFFKHIANFGFQIFNAFVCVIKPKHVAIQFLSYVIVQFPNIFFFKSKSM